MAKQRLRHAAPRSSRSRKKAGKRDGRQSARPRTRKKNSRQQSFQTPPTFWKQLVCFGLIQGVWVLAAFGLTLWATWCSAVAVALISICILWGAAWATLGTRHYFVRMNLAVCYLASVLLPTCLLGGVASLVSVSWGWDETWVPRVELLRFWKLFVVIALASPLVILTAQVGFRCSWWLGGWRFHYQRNRVPAGKMTLTKVFAVIAVLLVSLVATQVALSLMGRIDYWGIHFREVTMAACLIMFLSSLWFSVVLRMLFRRRLKPAQIKSSEGRIKLSPSRLLDTSAWRAILVGVVPMFGLTFLGGFLGGFLSTDVMRGWHFGVVCLITLVLLLFQVWPILFLRQQGWQFSCGDQRAGRAPS